MGSAAVHSGSGRGGNRSGAPQFAPISPGFVWNVQRADRGDGKAPTTAHSWTHGDSYAGPHRIGISHNNTHGQRDELHRERFWRERDPYEKIVILMRASGPQEAWSTLAGSHEREDLRRCSDSVS